MTNFVNIDIITPLKLVISKKVKMSVLPASEGDVGILYKHTPLMTILNRGIVKLYDENSISDQIVVDGGVADISEDKITILSERAECLGNNSINKKLISEKISILKNNLYNKKTDTNSIIDDEIDFLNYVMDNLWSLIFSIKGKNIVLIFL